MPAASKSTCSHSAWKSLCDNNGKSAALWYNGVWLTTGRSIIITGADAVLTRQLSTPAEHTGTPSTSSSHVGRPLVQADFRPAASWLRIGPTWAVLAGALSGLPLGQWDAALLLNVVAAILLADPIWGAFWHTARDEAGAVADSGLPLSSSIPYAIPGSPAARLTAWLRGPTSAMGHPPTWQAAAGWPIALLLAVVLALPLGPAALIFTAGVLGLSLLRLLWIRGDRPPPAFLDAILVLGLPWLLGSTVTAKLTPAGFALAGAFGLVVWGVLRAAQGRRRARRLILLGQAAAIVTLAWQGLPLAAGLITACFLMPWWLLAWPPQTAEGDRALHAAQPWLLCAMLLSVTIRS